MTATTAAIIQAVASAFETAFPDRVRAIGERNLAFENFYFETYRDFLLVELMADAGRIKHALDFLHLTAFCDPGVRAIVEYIQSGDDPDLTDAANKALASINQHCP